MTNISQYFTALSTDLEHAKVLFKHASTGLRFDSSWIRPKVLTDRERLECYQQGVLILDKYIDKTEEGDR